MIELVADTKFCVNCEYVATSTAGSDRYRCLAPQNLETEQLNLVTGEGVKLYTYIFCVQTRDTEAACGKAGKWFKQKVYELKEIFPVETPKQKAGKITADDL